MKILLTGASGFVGSHIFDSLRDRGIKCVILLREGSNRRFIEQNLEGAEVKLGDFLHLDSLAAAFPGVTHVLHCAGCIRALKACDFYVGNQVTTRNLVTAAKRAGVQRFVFMSSLAAVGPDIPGADGRAESRVRNPAPVSEYGRSKLAAEQEVEKGFPGAYVILRPPAVYGPRDTEFLRLFKASKKHIIPGSRQPLSLVYVKDLAEVALECLSRPEAVGRNWFVANPEVVTARDLGQAVAAELGLKAVSLPMPKPALFALCLAGEAQSWVTRKPNVLSLYKYPELVAPGWVCDSKPLRTELGLECPTVMHNGIRQTLAWYVANRWL